LPGQADSFANHINSSGAVVGSSGSRAFVWQNCTMKDLGTLGGSQASAQSISKQGAIVGWSLNAAGRKRAFAYGGGFGGLMTDLGGVTNLNQAAMAVSGWQIPVGVESVPAIPTNADPVWYFNGRTYALPQVLVYPPSGYANIQNVTDVNDILQVTGYLTVSGSQIGYVSASSFGAWTRIQGIPGFGNLVPYAINENGHVVGGQYSDPFHPHAFLSKNANLPAADLKTLGGDNSTAYGVNSNDWVVGFSDSSPTSGPLAFLYNGTTMIDLNTRLVNGAGWKLLNATGINDSGQIIGNGTYNGQQRAFLLLPRAYPWGPVTTCISVVSFPGNF
jgi:probable HAF family extracellular repeat protein